MTIVEKIAKARDKTIFTLHREGLFFKCYNEDAMVFSKRVKNYKVNSKFVKSVGAEVSSLGFPASEASKGNLSFDMLCETLRAEKYDDGTEKVTFYLKDNIKQGFESWHKEVVNENSAQYAKEPNNNTSATNESYITELVAMIKNFDLANSTPMQGLSFIQQLKMEVQRIEKNNGNI